MRRLLLLILVCVGCDSPPPAGTIDAGVARPLTVAPGRLDFGVLAAGVARSLELEVRNPGRVATISALTFTDPRFRSPAELPLTVPAEGVLTLAIEATATDAAPFEGTLVITSEQGALTVPLLGNRSAPCLTASAQELDFGTAEPGCRSRDQRAVISNTCSHAVQLTGSTASGGFAIVAGALSTLAPGQTAEFALSFGPASVGAASGALTITADVLDGSQQVSVPLRGEGAPMVVIDEGETRPPRPQRDVLVVIDDSATMLPFADAVRTNLGRLAQDASHSGEDVRIGVMSTSTDPIGLGTLRRTGDGAAWLDEPTQPALEELGAVRGLSTSRSSCLEALHAAFSLRADLGAMLRPGAGLQVICITNGVDGLETAPLPVITSLLAMMPRWTSVTVVARFAETPGCPGVIDQGQLRTLTERSNGRREEICTAQWLLYDVTSYFGWRTNFYLSQRPSFVRAPLRVWSNEVELLEREMMWTYSSENNGVWLEPFSVPAPGSRVRFRYSPDCP